MQIQVEPWPVDRLIPYARNARTHSDSQAAQVAGSIAEFGFVNPILVGPDGVIVAGDARLAAARRLKLTEVPVIVLAHLTETQQRALVLADNNLCNAASGISGVMPRAGLCRVEPYSIRKYRVARVFEAA
jgi:ParB-like chromosome segregation protein Spo0J